MLVYAISVALVVAVVVLSPFVKRSTQTLASAQGLDSVATLKQVKAALVRRFLEDEQAFKAGDINKYMWEKRRLFLVNRYVDAARRLDYLERLSIARSASSTPEATHD